MSTSKSGKFLSAISAAILSPRSAGSWIRRGHLAKDPLFISQTYWCFGELPRVPLTSVFKEAGHMDIVLPRALDRKLGTSITAEEACQVAAIAKCLRPAKVLEIGTFDGNTTLVLAANLESGGSVVTVDLPPDFDLSTQKSSLTYADGEINLTPREVLGRQYRDHPLASKIRQVYGDSASLDWSGLGGAFGMIFIDGCHTEAYVRSDTKNALRHLEPGGVIVWHDYGMIPDVSVVVDEYARAGSSLKVHAIAGTRLAIGVSVVSR